VLYLPQRNVPVTALFFTAPRASKGFFWCSCWSSLQSDAGAGATSSLVIVTTLPGEMVPSRMLPRSYWLFLFLMLMMSKRRFVRYSSLTALAETLVRIADYMAVHVSKIELAANPKAETIR
jgi:hypothetical protein